MMVILMLLLGTPYAGYFNFNTKSRIILTIILRRALAVSNTTFVCMIFKVNRVGLLKQH